MICFICGKELGFESFTMNPDSAIEFNYEAAFGSIHDGDVGIIHICDDCYAERIHRVFAVHNFIEESEK